MDRPRRLLTLTLFLTTVLSAALAAQGSVGRVSGTIKDENGKPVAGATITASNPDQAPNTFTASTDARGRTERGDLTALRQLMNSKDD